MRYQLNHTWTATTGRWTVVTLLAGLIIFFGAQGALAGGLGNFGSIKDDPGLKTAVAKEGILPDYTYYFTGRSHLPYAVVGLDPSYKLKKGFWSEIGSKDQALSKISSLMPTEAVQETYGWILDPDGRRIGVWFSGYWHTVIRFSPVKEVEILSPYNPNDAS